MLLFKPCLDTNWYYATEKANVLNQFSLKLSSWKIFNDHTQDHPAHPKMTRTDLSCKTKNARTAPNWAVIGTILYDENLVTESMTWIRQIWSRKKWSTHSSSFKNVLRKIKKELSSNLRQQSVPTTRVLSTNLTSYFSAISFQNWLRIRWNFISEYGACSNTWR